MLKIKKLRENAKVPQYATSGSAGLDLSACIDEPLTLKPQERALVPTGLAVEIETGKVGLVFARSGISIKKGIALSLSVEITSPAFAFVHMLDIASFLAFTRCEFSYLSRKI